MFVNTITKFLLTVITFLVTPLKWLMTVPTGLLFHIPLVGTVYEALVMVLWLPFSAFISLFNSLYAHVPVIGFLLSFIGIPIVLVGYVVGLLLSPGGSEDRNFIQICRSYPFPATII
jgi:hypothetical protein